jgi:hypothetical protein
VAFILERTYGSLWDCGPMNLNMTSVLFVQQPPFCDCSPTLEDRSYSINKLPLIQCTSCDRSFTGFLSPDQSTGHGNFNPTNEVPCTFRFRCHWFDHHMGTSADRDSDMQPNCLYWLAWRLHSYDLVISESFISTNVQRSRSSQLRISLSKDTCGSLSKEEASILMYSSCTRQNSSTASNYTGTIFLESSTLATQV